MLFGYLRFDHQRKESRVMETLSIAEFALRLGVGVGCGALIGIERQWQARRAATNDSSPTRVASYVVSGVGFLGGGVILREGFNVHGLNTAATLWCSAAVGVLAASGHLLFALIATGTIVGIHLLGRPLGRLIDRGGNVVEEDEDDQPYQLQVICRPKQEKYARAQIVQHTSGGDFVLRGIHTGRGGDDSIALTAYLLSDRHAPARLEQLVADLSLQPGVQAVHWYAGDQDEPMPRAPHTD
jgi:putative Mg2+ transporter-C (MgtC) family protein